MTMSVLCALVCLFSLVTADYEFVFDSKKRPSNQSVSILAGSTVTLLCRNRVGYNRVTWYKYPMAVYAAYFDYNGGECRLVKEHYPSISPGRHNCTGNNFSIKFTSIETTDQGWWLCQLANGTKIKVSQKLYINVTAPIATEAAIDGHEIREISTPGSDRGGEGMKRSRKHLILGLAGGLGVLGFLLMATLTVIIIQRRRTERTNSVNSAGFSSIFLPHGDGFTEGESTEHMPSSAQNYSVLCGESQEYPLKYETIKAAGRRLQSQPVRVYL